MYRLVNTVIQLLLKALEFYEKRMREEELANLTKERRKFEHEMSKAKDSDELADIISDWSRDGLLTSSKSDNSEELDNSSQADYKP